MFSILPIIQREIIELILSLTGCAPGKSKGDSADTDSGMRAVEMPLSHNDIYQLMSPPDTSMCGIYTDPESAYQSECTALRIQEYDRFRDTIEYLSGRQIEDFKNGEVSYQIVLGFNGLGIDFYMTPDLENCPFDPDQVINGDVVTQCGKAYWATPIYTGANTVYNAEFDLFASAGHYTSSEKETGQSEKSNGDEDIQTFLIGRGQGIIDGAIMADTVYNEAETSGDATLGLVTQYIGLEGKHTKLQCFEPECEWEDAGAGIAEKMDVGMDFVLWLAAQEGEPNDIGLSELNQIYEYDGYTFHPKGQEWPVASAKTNVSSSRPVVGNINGIKIVDDSAS